MHNERYKNSICCLLMSSIFSLIFLLICVSYVLTSNYTINMEAFQFFSIINLISWLCILFIMSKIEYSSSLLTRILITLISLVIILITFFSTGLLFNSIIFLLSIILIINYFFYLLEYTKW